MLHAKLFTMTGLQSLAARTALGSFAALATLILPVWKKLFQGAASNFDRRLSAVFIASRVALYLFIFGLLRLEPRGDIRYYFREATQRLQGALPYRGIDTVYAPLHSYMDAAVLRLWNSPLALIAFVIVVEGISFPLWMRVARELWPENDRRVRLAGLFYLLCPLSLQFVAIDGQNNVVISMFFALALLLALRYREVFSGLMVGLSISIVKFLPLIFAPIFFVSLKRRWRWALGGLLGTVPIYAYFAYLKLNILLPLRQGSLKGAGGVPYWIEAATRLQLSGMFWHLILILPVIGVIVLAGWTAHQRTALPTKFGGYELHRERIRIVLLSLGAMTLVLVCFAEKTWPTYTLMALFPICVAVALEADRRGWVPRLLFAIFGLICMVEHSYYSTILNGESAATMRQQLDSHDLVAWVFLGIDILLLSGYFWLLWLSVRAIRTQELPVPSPVS
jgi:uncharacterized protein YjeT (DUF2065 family)